MTKRAPGIATIVLAGLLGLGCVPSAPSPVSTDAPSSQASGSTGTCPPIDLTMPSGEQLNLTGTWRGAGNLTFVRQVGSCVSWLSLSDNPGQEPGANEMVAFRGSVASDFTVSGEWMYIVRGALIPGAFSGSTTFAIAPAGVEGDDPMALRSMTTTCECEGGGPYGLATLTYIGPLPRSE